LEDIFFTTSSPEPSDLEVDTIKEEPSKQTETFETSLSTIDIQALDDSFYYNSDGEIFSLKLVYVQTDALMGKTISNIAELLETKGIALNVKALDLGEITL
jgi:hypothetical protein